MSEVPIKDMLGVSQEPLHRSRMAMLGNIVVPPQAFLGFSVLALLVQGNFDM